MRAFSAFIFLLLLAQVAWLFFDPPMWFIGISMLTMPLLVIAQVVAVLLKKSRPAER